MDTSARAQDSSPLSISTIGEDLTITGNVTSKGELHLDGEIQGDVHCVALVLGEHAQLNGGVVAEDVMDPWPPYRLGPCTEGDVAVPGPRQRQPLSPEPLHRTGRAF